MDEAALQPVWMQGGSLFGLYLRCGVIQSRGVFSRLACLYMPREGSPPTPDCP